MVISQLVGGLGNQMFQYAAGRALSLARDQPLRLDVSELSASNAYRQFELQRIFNCPIAIATESDLRDVLGWQFPSALRRFLSRPGAAAFRRESFVVEPHFHYWQGISKVPSACYLRGYWQSERYFLTKAAQIRADFSFTPPSSSRNAECLAQIGEVSAVSVHLRRGDFASNASFNTKHGLCSLDYYRAASRYMAEKLVHPQFFVFSDDREWTRDNFKIDYPCQFVDCNRGAESYNDMLLMSACQHHIIANSTFGWWGAWLNPRPEKIVIAPKKWFASGANAPDLIPSSWVVL